MFSGSRAFSERVRSGKYATIVISPTKSQGDACNASAFQIFKVLNGIATVIGRRDAYHQAHDMFASSLDTIKNMHIYPTLDYVEVICICR